MEYTVLKSFIDRETLARVPVGAMYPCEDPARVALLQERGYISVEPPAKPKSKKKKRDE